MNYREVETLLGELADCRELLTNAEHTVQLREQELFEERRANEVLLIIIQIFFKIIIKIMMIQKKMKLILDLKVKVIVTVIVIVIIIIVMNMKIMTIIMIIIIMTIMTMMMMMMKKVMLL